MVRPNLPSQFIITGIPAVNAAETVVASYQPISTSAPGATVRLFYSFQIGVAAGGTLITVQIRRNSLTGNIVMTKAFTATASTFMQCDGGVVDSPGEVAGLVYVITVTVTAGGANSATGPIALTAIVE